MKSYYHILGLTPGASETDVKRAYRKLARKYHPDVNRAHDAVARFQEIEEAYRKLMAIRSRVGKEHSTSFDRAEAERRQTEKARKEKARIIRERMRRMEEMEMRMQREAFHNGFTWLIIILVAFVVFRGSNAVYHYYKINQLPEHAWATVIQAEGNTLKYRFETVSGTLYSSEMYVGRSYHESLSGNGMPLQRGDEFRIRYNSGEPEYHKVLFDRYSDETAQQYIQLTYDKIRQSAHYADHSDEELSCLVYTLFLQKGESGLSKLYFHDEPLLENFKRNSLTFWFFTRSKVYSQSKQDCAS